MFKRASLMAVILLATTLAPVAFAQTDPHLCMKTNGRIYGVPNTRQTDCRFDRGDVAIEPTITNNVINSPIPCATYDDDKKLVQLSGCNLQIVNGTGVTETSNGLGNLIIGYNETVPGVIPDVLETGSHNLAVGIGNSYSSYGGIVAGFGNSISANYASAVGGAHNSATAGEATVMGGLGNLSSGPISAVCGGSYNTASEILSSVHGGDSNIASGWGSSVVGGRFNLSDAYFSTVSGGVDGTASGLCQATSGVIDDARCMELIFYP